MCDMIVRALREHPTLNATFDDAAKEIRRHAAVHLGIGTATDRGLLVTVVRDAHTLGVAALSTEMRRLSEAARGGSITPAELVGSTFTVSNFGALGLDDGVPVINHPEAAIIGIGAVRERPHVVDGQLVVRHTANVTLAFDHRVADGGEAAVLLTTVRDLIEAPELALVTP
jgi:pyruvate dehydrogenase E2 component (dihydrolipoamide acetyltransferase)